MKRMAILAAALSCSGCMSVATLGVSALAMNHPVPAPNCPPLKQTVRVVSDFELIDTCGPFAEACAVISFERGTCEILHTGYLLPLMLEHEREHCRCHDHIGSSVLADRLAAWRKERQQ